MITLERLFQNNPIFDDDTIGRNQEQFDYILGVVNGAMTAFHANPYERAAQVLSRPQRIDDHDSPFMRSFMARDVLVWYFSWAIPNAEAIEELVKRSPIVEIAAGRGYWADCVTKSGGKIICYDNLEDNPNLDLQWFPVCEGSYTKVLGKPNHTLFMCWPPYDNPLAFNTLKLYEGQTFIYVGEGEGGCTGDDYFHKLLAKEWKEVKTIHIPQWWGIHDYMVVYERI